jgi:hypothetical protein
MNLIFLRCTRTCCTELKDKEREGMGEPLLERGWPQIRRLQKLGSSHYIFPMPPPSLPPYFQVDSWIKINDDSWIQNNDDSCPIQIKYDSWIQISDDLWIIINED